MSSRTFDVELRGIDTVRLEKDALLVRIRKNKEDHRAIFEEAIEGWKREVTRLLEDAVEQAKSGKDFITSIYVPRPEDHTDEYDTIIEMLEMSLDDELELSQTEFACYGLDKWGWQSKFLSTSSMYVASASNKKRIADKGNV